MKIGKEDLPAEDRKSTCLLFRAWYTVCLPTTSYTGRHYILLVRAGQVEVKLSQISSSCQYSPKLNDAENPVCD